MHPNTKVSTSDSIIGAKYSRATFVIASPEVSPRSTYSTKSGHAIEVICNCGAAAKASKYAFESMVALVPITPMRPVRVAATARRTAG